MDCEKLRREVCDMALRACRTGLFEGTCGNLSALDRERGVVVITPSQVPYEEYAPEEMVLLDLEGRVIGGKHRPSSEWIMHTMVYREKPEVGAVLHTHSPYATAFAVCGESIPCVLIEMVPALGGDVPLAPFGMPGTEEVARSAIDALRERRGCILANHGVLAVGAELESAYRNAGYVENAARICSIALSTGMPIHPLSRERYQAVKAHYEEAFR